MTEVATPRQAVLDARIAELTSGGARVAAHGKGWAQLIMGKRYNWLFHCVATLVSVGLWFPIALIIRLFGGEQTINLFVDDSGRLTERKHRRR
jgi:hypothetical protein